MPDANEKNLAALMRMTISAWILLEVVEKVKNTG